MVSCQNLTSAKGHFSSLLLSNIIGYLSFLQIGPLPLPRHPSLNIFHLIIPFSGSLLNVGIVFAAMACPVWFLTGPAHFH